MADTTFVPGTVVASSWLNDVNRTTYENCINVRSDPYNATGDGSTDDTAALLAAFAAAEAAGVPVYFPSGTYKYTTALPFTANIPGIFGNGWKSTLAPTGCNGITLSPKGFYAGSNFMRDFLLLGTTCENFTGIFFSDPTLKVTGMHVENLAIQNFKYGMLLKNAWQWTILNCFFYNNYNGVQLLGFNIETVFIRCFLQRGSLTGSGVRYGFQCLTDGGGTAQATRLFGCSTYNYEIGFYAGSGTFDTSLIGSDFNVCTSACVQLGAVQGGFSIRDCWLETFNASSTTYGVQLVDLGTGTEDKVVIEGCQMSCSLPAGGGVGVYIGTNVNSVTCNNNTIGSVSRYFTTGIQIVVNNNATAKFNTIYANTTAITINSSAVNPDIGPNNIQNGTPLTFSSGASQPPGFKYYSKGTFTITLTGMTALTTGTVNWVSDGSVVTLSVPAAILGTSNSTAMLGTGVPQDIRPFADQFANPVVSDNSVFQLGSVTIPAASGNFTFTSTLATASLFTAANNKGLKPQTISYSRG